MSTAQKCRTVWETRSNKSGSRRCKIPSKDGMISCQSIKRDRNICRVNRRESSARGPWASGLKTMSGSGMTSRKGMHRQKESVAEAELDGENHRLASRR